MTYKLCISIPTYNRLPHVQRQLDFLLGERVSFDRGVCVVVSNNASTDGTLQMLSEHPLMQLPNTEIVCQATNLGIMGNIRYLIENAQAEYVWVLSDDDVLKAGVVAEVLDMLEARSPGLLHLGWGIISTDYSQVLAEKYYGYSVLRNPEFGHSAFISITQSEHLGVNFISGNIWRASLAQRALHEFRGSQNNLALPLFVSAFCSNFGGFAFIKSTWVYGRIGDLSWSDDDERFNYYDVPICYQQLTLLGFTRSQVFAKHLRFVTPRLFSYFRRRPFEALRSWVLFPLRMLFAAPLRLERESDRLAGVVVLPHHVDR